MGLGENQVSSLPGPAKGTGLVHREAGERRGMVAAPWALVPVAPLCPPPLQLFDAHHEVEVALRVLLDDIAHVIGLPCLLQARETCVIPHVPWVGLRQTLRPARAQQPTRTEV